MDEKVELIENKIIELESLINEFKSENQIFNKQQRRKNYNKKLESWLCFSIIIDKRSLDFHCQPE